MNLKLSIVLNHIYFLAILASPLPQEDSEGNLRTKTDLCNEFEFQEFVSDQVQCYTEARRVVDESIASGDSIPGIKRAICKSITGEADCIRSIDSKSCFDEEQTRNVLNNFLDKEFEKTFNNSELFGREFIESCPILKDNEEELVKVITGTNQCNYYEFQESAITLKKCSESAKANRDFKLSLISFSNDPLPIFTQAWCEMTEEYKNCRLNYNKCLSQEKRNIIKMKEEAFFKEIEDAIAERSIDGFTLAKNCEQN